MVERLWAGWRAAYLEDLDTDRSATPSPGTGQSLFESILASGRPDDETFILWRGEHCFSLLNLYPYTTGHVLVLPNRAVRDLEELDAGTAAELWSAVRDAVVAVKAAYRPDGVNVGANLGRAAGAGIPDHLHVHVLPRWLGDTNFTMTVAETRVIPESLQQTWRKLRDTWPA